MNIYRYRLSFTSPAFLGNASQSAQWRTPPIKALLRQWWRVVVAQQVRYDIDTLRTCENAMFGTAADSGDSHRSRIRIRLGSWTVGKLTSWEGLEQLPVDHREAERSGRKVGPHAYLGYGPLDGRGGTRFGDKAGAAIQAGESATLSLAIDADAVQKGGGLAIAQTLQSVTTVVYLMDRFGTLGGRSRNGWGSLSLQADDQGTPALQGCLEAALTRYWRDALNLDWPHALGRDEKGALVWQTSPFGDWKLLMRELARLKIELRTQFKFPHERPDGQIHDRHWLSYPVTTHKVAAWDWNGARLPNTLRFKVRPAPGNPSQVVGVIFHMPCLPPPAFNPDLRAITRVWQTVHGFLDMPAQHLTRIPA